MKTVLAAAFASVVGMTSTAWAAAEPFEDHSGLFVWIFLGFCALIVVAQLLPALMMLVGMAKGVKEQAEEAEEKAVK
jgi:hypothetical protein